LRAWKGLAPSIAVSTSSRRGCSSAFFCLSSSLRRAPAVRRRQRRHSPRRQLATLPVATLAFFSVCFVRTRSFFHLLISFAARRLASPAAFALSLLRTPPRLQVSSLPSRGGAATATSGILVCSGEYKAKAFAVYSRVRGSKAVTMASPQPVARRGNKPGAVAARARTRARSKEKT
jgi:hypothetical protein